MSEHTSHTSWSQRMGLVFKHLTPYKGELLLLSLLGVISATTGAAVPLIMGRFLDGVVSGKQMLVFGLYSTPYWVIFLVLFVVIQMLNDLVSWIINTHSARFGTLMHAVEHANGYNKLLRLPFEFHKNSKSGEVTSARAIDARICMPPESSRG